MNAKPIKPVMIKAIPSPLRGAGTSEYLIFSLMAAKATMAKKKPKPLPIPNTVLSIKLYSFEIINKVPPKMEQFTVIRGKKIPKDIYNAGENFSIIISTNCTKAAITPMYIIRPKNSKLTSAKEGLIQESAPSTKRFSLIIQLIGAVMANTKITAAPKPTAVLTVFETAR